MKSDPPIRRGSRFPVVEYGEVIDDIARGFEVAGVAIIAIGCAVALVTSFKDFTNLDKYFEDVRRGFGRPLILGLEILVAADIITTITVDPSLESVTVLAILVAVRIALSFSLDIEVDGIVPWHRAKWEAMRARAGESETD
jgi:uncharacterized membrane protein